MTAPEPNIDQAGASDAANALAGWLDSAPWLVDAARLNDAELELSRLSPFLARRWVEMAGQLPDARVGELVVDVAISMPEVHGSDPSSWRYISRRELKSLGARAKTDAEDRIRLWVATMIWGHSLDNRGPRKVASSLGSRSLTQLATSLTSSWNSVAADRLVEAHQACEGDASGSLATVGQSFFTKWLWAAGLSLSIDTIHPLILDGNILRVRRGQPGWTLHGENPAQRWVYYCSLASEVAHHLRRRYPGIDSEKVEYALYCLASRSQ